MQVIRHYSISINQGPSTVRIGAVLVCRQWDKKYLVRAPSPAGHPLLTAKLRSSVPAAEGKLQRLSLSLRRRLEDSCQLLILEPSSSHTLHIGFLPYFPCPAKHFIHWHSFYSQPFFSQSPQHIHRHLDLLSPNPVDNHPLASPETQYTPLSTDSHLLSSAQRKSLLGPGLIPSRRGTCRSGALPDTHKQLDSCASRSRTTHLRSQRHQYAE